VAIADEPRIGGVVRELLDNACRYSPPGRPVELLARNLDEGVVVMITDRGEGLDRAVAVQRLLVDPFAGFGPGITVTTVMGVNQRTGDTIIRAGEAFTKIVMLKHAGDNLVPFDRTIAWGGNAFHFTVVPFAGQTRPHAELCTDVGVAPFVMHQVNAPAPFPPA
jgi:hypothetical protein